VEDMVLNPGFLGEIVDFAQAMTLHDNSENQLSINPLVRSIGFLETMNFLRELSTDKSGAS
jgi:hypothetical protein